MFWADKAADRIEKDLKDRIEEGRELVVRDEKTASGHPHVGSLVGVGVHDTIARVLNERNVSAKFYYEINDTDPMDGLPSYLDAEVYEEYMGKSLRHIPAPDDSAANLAEYFAKDFMAVIEESGFTPTFYKTSELYDSGRMNDVIRLALEGADKIREIYKKVSGSEKPEDWLPLNVVCENCGKISTTKVTAFDGEKVSYTCRGNAVEWAKGCGYEGNISPFDGNATLPWKVEWAAKFKVVGVDVEGAGKDHSTKGGARDVANKIAREVFDYIPPFDIPYEFFLVGGKKMSSSKGNASTAREVADMLPSHILHLALIGREINRQSNFDPEGDSIPLLFDQYDRLAEKYWSGAEDDQARTFKVIHTEKDQELLKERFLPRFSQIAYLVQMKHLDLLEEIEKIKEAPLTDTDKKEVDLRAAYAEKWLSGYAPESYKFVLQTDAVPDAANAFDEIQKTALKKVLAYVEEHTAPDGQELHSTLHDIRKETDIEPKAFFSALYTALLGKDSGPKAGWFLSTVPREFLIKRLTETTQ